ncbi:MAG TPA: dienelactone hydrolase family protein [Burkholderiaceae bacterium]|nr:dienelactone hydrolase family protein [Burkholderiaceae bacterium]
MPDLLDCVELQTRSDPAYTVLWLHGLGADGYDFVPVVRELELAGAPPVRYVFPHAPQIPVTINGGYVMRAWYDILGAEVDRREDEARIRASAGAVERLIEREAGRGVARGRIVLAGFSQGGAITLQAGLRAAEPLAGMMALSTYLPLANSAAAEATPASRRTPIFMAHGTADPVIPFARSTASRDRLQDLGYQVEWHEYPMQHSVNADEIRAIAAFLRRVLA